MSRISSEPRFQRAFTITVVALASLCAIFLGLAYLQGPKLESAQVDTDRVVTESAQSLRVFANQSVREVAASQVSVEPRVPVSVDTSGELIAITFGERLHYASEYTVTIADVTGVSTQRASTLHYSFTTGAPDLYYLDRGVPDDEIIRTGLSGAERTVVYAAPRIQDFGVVTPTVFAVVTVDDAANSALSLVDTESGLVERVVLPVEGSIDNFHVDDAGTTLGFEFTSADRALRDEYSRTLVTINLDAGRDLVAVAGVDGAPLHVLDWFFSPGTASVIALSMESSALLVTPAGDVTPLGQYTRIDSISPDGRTLTAVDTFGAIRVDVATLDKERLEPSPLDGEVPSGAQVTVLPDGSRVQLVFVYDPAVAAFRSAVVLDDGVASRLLYATPKNLGAIDSFSVSPNAQYVAIEAVPNEADRVGDGYALNWRSPSIQTIIVDVATGAAVRIVDGFSLQF